MTSTATWLSMTTSRRVVGIRLGAEVRHQSVLLARDPGPMIGYVVMAMLLITVTRPMYDALGHFVPGLPPFGIDQAAAGMAVMFSLFALKVVGAHMLNERTWNTWDRLRATPAGFGEILFGKALPLYGAIVVQQAVLFGFSAVVFGLHPKSGWWVLALCGLCWSAWVLLLGTASSTLARSPAQLSAGGDMFAMLTTILGGALVPVLLLPVWLRHLAPISPGYWAMQAYRAALLASPRALVRPLAMLGVFGMIGVALAAVIGRVQR
jgi:ABC-2 type transport system permease protein